MAFEHFLRYHTSSKQKENEKQGSEYNMLQKSHHLENT